MTILRDIDDRLLALAQTAYLELLDRFGLMKGDALAALLVSTVALGPPHLASIALKLVGLGMCLHLSARQRHLQFAYLNANAQWLADLRLLRLVAMILAISHVLREPRLAVVLSQLVALAAIYLWAAKVRKRDGGRFRRSGLAFSGA